MTRGRVVSLVVTIGAAALAGGVAILAVIDPVHSAWGLAWIGFLLVGTMILWRLPENRIGWLLLAVGAGFDLTVVQQWFAHSSFGPGPVAVEVGLSLLQVLTWLALIALVAVFPDGRSTTRLQVVITRALVGVAVVVVAASLVGTGSMDSGRPNPLAIGRLSGLTDWLMNGPGFMIVPLLLIASLVSVVQRWTASRGVARLQFRWLIWAVSLSIAAIVILFTSDFSGFAAVLGVLALNAIPVAIGIAVTRYHLYDIDRIISRTTSYGIVTGLLVATYLTVIGLATSLFGKASSLSVAAATLTAAALARPLLRRVQDSVDRRFNRARYDAMHTVDAFGTRLGHQVDPDHVGEDLLAVVTTTLQPDQVTLWVREAT